MSRDTLALSFRRAPPRTEALTHFGAATVGVAAIALAALATSDVDSSVSVLRVVGVAIPVTFALVRLAHARSDRFSLLLLGAGVLLSLTTLGEAGSPVAYSVGRIAGWLIEPVIVLLMLAFPLGRIERAAERRLAQAVGLLVLLLYVPTALVSEFPEPSPWATCDTSCPSNAFALGDGSVPLVDDLIRPLREVLTALLFTAVTVVLYRRARRSGPISRRVLNPIVVVAMARAIELAVYAAARTTGTQSAGVDALGWLYVLSLPTVTLAFAGGLLAHRLFVAGALQELTRTFAAHPSARDLRHALSRALQDPSLEIRFWVPGPAGGWVDERGRRAAPPEGGPDGAVTEVSSGGRLLAAIVHDRGLADDPPLLDAVTSYAVTALENRQLIGQLESSLQELSESRARLVTVADEERRRIERDLHDGAQQRLVALQIKLEMLAERLDDESPGNAARARLLEDEIAETLDEVRRFGSGVYPPLLADRGLADALRAVARTSPVPTVVDVETSARFPREIEGTIYFACVEALQNAMKHADGVSTVHVRVSTNGRLRFVVRDDGVGFDPSRNGEGNGLTNMRDRVEALGGTLEVRSQVGRGTRVSGWIPLP